jgi:hypothetical protein
VTPSREPVAGSWRKSSECVNGECVEIARGPGTVLLRRSDTPGVLEFTASEWAVFVDALRRGEFDGVDGTQTGLAAG